MAKGVAFSSCLPWHKHQPPAGSPVPRYEEGQINRASPSAAVVEAHTLHRPGVLLFGRGSEWGESKGFNKMPLCLATVALKARVHGGSTGCVVIPHMLTQLLVWRICPLAVGQKIFGRTWGALDQKFENTIFSENGNRPSEDEISITEGFEEQV